MKTDRIFKPISLLPPEYKKQILMLKMMKYVVLCTGLFLLLTSLLYIVTPYLFWSTNQAVAVVENDIANIKHSISGMQKYEEVYNKEKKYDDILSRAMGKVPDWDEVMTDVFTTKPIRVLINSMKVSKDAPVKSGTSTEANTNSQTNVVPQVTGYSLVIDGVSEDLNELSRWVEGFKAEEGYSDAKIATVTVDKNGYVFQVILSVKPGKNYEFDEGGKP